MANTRDLIQNSFNLKLEGPFNGDSSAQPVVYEDLRHQRYTPQFGRELEAAQLDGDEARFIIPDQEAHGPEPDVYWVNVHDYKLEGNYTYKLTIINA